MKVIVIGGDGLVGSALAKALPEYSHVAYPTTRRKIPGDRRLRIDLSGPDVEQAPLPKADVAVFCAAINGFANCRVDPALSRQVNVVGTTALARRLVAQGTYVLLLSSTAVFDFRTPFVKADAPVSPLNLHGQLKSETEAHFLGLGQQAAVLRLTKVLANDATLFTTWIDALRRGKPTTAYSDIHIAPISINDAISAILAACSDQGTGIYQMSGARDISYFEALTHVAKRLGADPSLVRSARAVDAGIPPCDVAMFTSLDCSRLQAITGRAPPDPFAVLDAVFQLTDGSVRQTVADRA